MENIGGNSIIVKEININFVRKILKIKGKATKQEIAKETGLSFVTVGTALQYLLNQNEIFETTMASSNGGRPAQQYSYNYDYSFALVLFLYEIEDEIFIHSSVINLSGNSIYENDRKVKNVDLHIFEEIIEPLIKKYFLIKVIGFGHHGLDLEGKIILSDYKSLIGTSFEEYFNNLYNLPVVIENNVNSAVVGFGKRRTVKEDETLVYVHFSESHPPRAGVLINGKLFKGKTNFAGEISTIPLNINWNNELYKNSEETCESIAKLVVTISSLINPHTVILNGKFLDKFLVSSIIEKCKERLPQNIVPNIFHSENFMIDYKNGLTLKTLEQLEPNISLIKKKNSI